MRQDGGSPKRLRGRRERGSPTSPQKAQEDLWPPPPPPETQNIQVSVLSVSHHETRIKPKYHLPQL